MTLAFDRFFKTAAVLAALSACLLLSAAPARAQGSFVEGFDDVGGTQTGQDGPANLMSRGWIFRNQSNPKGATSWHDGFQGGGWPAPQAGTGYIGVASSSTDHFFGRVSNWALLPQVSGQRAGDQLTFYVNNRGGSVNPTLQVRYSPGGGTNTGADADAVGDFTELLLDINPLPADGGWNRYSVTLPGPGRVALRYYIANACNFSCGAVYLGVDSLSVGEPPPAACNLPPVPSAGQTVTWTAARSPYQVCENISIPPGSTVNVEPGVRVNFDSQRQLVVSGTLNVQGTAAARVSFGRAAGMYAPLIDTRGGTINASFVDFGLQLNVGTGSNVKISDSSFTNTAPLMSANLSGVAPFIQLERCTFDHTQMWLSDTVVRLRNNTFNDTYAHIMRGYADVTAPNTFTGQPLRVGRETAALAQGFYIDGVNATGIFNDAGLELAGGNFLLGPNTVLQNNQFALELEGGLLPGSKVPTTGNLVNAINVNAASFGGPGRWTNFGIPYRITKQSGTSPGGNLTIDPGVTVESDPTGWLLFRSTRRLIADGLPDAPITFKSSAPGQVWEGLTFATNSTEGPRLEYCRVSDARIGVNSTDNSMYVENCDFRNNQTGAHANSFGATVFGKTRFLANQTGASVTDLGGLGLNNPTNPNSFEGNTQGFDSLEQLADSDARNVWWGSPTGPRHPQNPAGTGDSIVGPGANGIQFQPFLTARPDEANTPPVVRLVEPGLSWNGHSEPPDYMLETGTKYVIRWEAKDTDAIVKQRILFSPDGHNDFAVVVADNLPGDQRSYEWTVPDPGFAVTNQPQFLRVVAVDAAGQEGWDQTPLLVPSGRIAGELTITTDLSGKTFYAGDPIPDIEWTGSVSDYPIVEPFVIFESDGDYLRGVVVNGRGMFIAQKFPAISTDRARLAVRVHNNGNDVKWFFAKGYFSVRHDRRLGLVPPAVQLLSPAAGASFSAGETVPITWSASDDERLYSFDIQASFDGGRTFHVVARDLPAAARSYDWQLPPNGGGLANVRIRVVARDIRFQNSASDGSFGAGGGGDQTPVSAPGVTTAAATSVAATSATLNATVNPEGDAATGWFEWGTSSTLSTYNTTTAQALGSGGAGVGMSQSLNTLAQNTVYYYRAAASNGGGATRGGIMSFRTPALPSLRVNSVTVAEANPGATTTAAFTVSLSAASGQTVTVKYQTANGSAVATADYDALAAATLTFEPGQTTKTLTVTVRGDALDETDETFRLLLSSPTNATVAVGAGTCTITDNDTPPSMTVTNVTVREPDTGTVNAVFTLRLSAASGRTVSVKYATANGTAAAGTDYTARALTTLTFSAGQTSRTVIVPVKGDTSKEDNETFFLNLSGAVNATVTDAQGQGTITNDD